MSHRDTQYLSVGDAKAVKDWPVGTTVRLKAESEDVLEFDEDRPIASITGYIPGVSGGVVISPKLDEMRAWNIDALEKVQ